MTSLVLQPRGLAKLLLLASQLYGTFLHSGKLALTAGDQGGLVVRANSRAGHPNRDGAGKRRDSPAGSPPSPAYGGVPKKEQARALKRGVDIVVATPGRLQDLVQEGSCRLDGVTYLVLDEADRMLDLGFEPDIRAIALAHPSRPADPDVFCHMPPAIRKLAAEFLANPVRVTVGSADISASHSVTQVVEVMDPRDRDARLLQLLRKWEAGKERVLVFVLYKVEAPRVEGLLRGRGFKVAAIHGNIGQDKRTEAVGELPNQEACLSWSRLTWRRGGWTSRTWLQSSTTPSLSP
eukprot:jgi/Botrbrau1/1415/Bobra.0063s0111.1